MYEIWGECVTVDAWVVDCWLVGPWVGNKLLFELHVSLLSSQTYIYYTYVRMCAYFFCILSHIFVRHPENVYRNKNAIIT